MYKEYTYQYIIPKIFSYVDQEISIKLFVILFKQNFKFQEIEVLHYCLIHFQHLTK